MKCGAERLEARINKPQGEQDVSPEWHVEVDIDLANTIPSTSSRRGSKTALHSLTITAYRRHRDVDVMVLARNPNAICGLRDTAKHGEIVSRNTTSGRENSSKPTHKSKPSAEANDSMRMDHEEIPLGGFKVFLLTERHWKVGRECVPPPACHNTLSAPAPHTHVMMMRGCGMHSETHQPRRKATTGLPFPLNATLSMHPAHTNSCSQRSRKKDSQSAVIKRSHIALE